MSDVSFPQTFAGLSRFALHQGFRPQTPGVEQPATGVFGVRGFASPPLGSRRLGLGRD